MKYPSIRIEGAILSADILDKIEQGELLGQKPKDFGFDGSNVRVKDEVVKAWADAQDMWRIYKRKMDDVSEHKAGTTETRNFWMVPLLGILGYDVELYRRAQEIHGKTYAISHKGSNIDNFPIHIMGFRDSLDKKRIDSGPRMSPHALVQEYINLNEHLYALVSNGLTIRLLRDSSRLIKLSFLEFDLEQMFEEEHFADFALMFRLIHCSRMPIKQTEGPESLIEGYHQDSLDSGSRIRDGLSNAVEQSIKLFANGFLSHPDNEQLRQAIIDEDLSANEFYLYQLRFIYRLLFLMVIEERDLIFPKESPRKKKDIYYNYYSVSRIRKLSEKRYLADKKYRDVWMSLKNTFKLFEKEFYGGKLNIKPLAGDLFGSNAIGMLNQCELDNKVMLECLTNLSVFTNPATQQKMRINYASLNVEEFGSVYEGLLEYDPVLDVNGSKVEFRFKAGDERSSSGSHYTPDELVQPLIKHSLEYIIEDKLKLSEPEKALLSITVCDVACGSGHILLSAARRIATELAKIRTGEDQPSPSAFREAVRDVIRHCIYGVDKNPLAVELAKVALWLEAHNPGEPLNFLDHKIKCGDAIVGLAHLEELENGIANEAFKKLPGDDDTASTFGKQNKKEKQTRQTGLDFDKQVGQKIEAVNNAYADFSKMPERTPEEIKAKQQAYGRLSGGPNWWKLKTLADIQTAQFFIPKTFEQRDYLLTESTYRDMLDGIKTLQGSRAVAKANAVSSEKRFFHWFLEFPEVFAGKSEVVNSEIANRDSTHHSLTTTHSKGFDCILGNPPYLWGNRISSKYGNDYRNKITYYYKGVFSNTDLCVFFLRRANSILNKISSLGYIVTNSVTDTDNRDAGIGFIFDEINLSYAAKNLKWIGQAKLFVALLCFTKELKTNQFIENSKVDYISPFLDSEEYISNPMRLFGNLKIGFKGVDTGGMGFVISSDEYSRIITKYKNEMIVVKSLFNASDILKRSKRIALRRIIDFSQLSEKESSKYKYCFQIIKERVKPYRETVKRERNRKQYWLYNEPRPGLYKNISGMDKFLVNGVVSKYIVFDFFDEKAIFTNAINVFAINSFSYYALLNSDIHGIWAIKWGSSLGRTPRYNITDCFETFPFPKSINLLEKLGKKLFEMREISRNNYECGLTDILNLYNNPNETSWINQHREIMEKINETVLGVYGWNDINLKQDFHVIDDLPENDRVRYTISPDARKEVLKRLLLLNHELYEQEVEQGLHDKKKTKAKAKKKPKVIENPGQVAMFSTGTQLTNKTLISEPLAGYGYQIGQNVNHASFGKGTIKDIEGLGDTAKITIRFESGEKKLVAKYANLGVE